MSKLFSLRKTIQFVVLFGFVFSTMAPSALWAKIDADQWHNEWEETKSDLEKVAESSPRLLKAIKKADNSTKIGTKLQKLVTLNTEYEEAQANYFNDGTPQNLKKWKQALKKFSKEMKKLAKAKNKYIGKMKTALQKAGAGEVVEDKFSLHKKNLKAIESGVRYAYGKHASFLEQNVTEASSPEEMLERQDAIKIKPMKAGLRNVAADLGKGIKQVNSKPTIAAYKKHLLEDIRTARGLLGECKQIDAIKDPPNGLHKMFDELETVARKKDMENEAGRLMEKKFTPTQEKAEELVVLRQLAELGKARKLLKKYVKTF